ncbi:MAG: aromatic ring-hydroxylating dioxygenase subunit alpha [Gammaproteobacteria bacterium]|nr:aromatic ring-hydroxylating dioxygenase subunit alpha [Gammaproteobacteria bacterium]
MFLRNCWYVACWSHELKQSMPLGVTIIGEPVVLYRRGDGQVVGLEDRCVHRLAPLSLGRCEGDNLRCMYHGLLFAPDGRCVDIPGQEAVPAKACVKTYPVADRHGWVWVWMGDPAAADDGLIPQSRSVDDPAWHFDTGSLDYLANYQLINDNLTDFSHLSFVHANSFNAGLNWALSRPEITQLERGIGVERWVIGDPVPPYLNGDFDTVDQYIRYDYLAPGILLLATEVHRGGTGERTPLGSPRPEPLFATFSPQAVTPIDEHNTRYFFAWGPRAVDGDKATAALMMQVARQAFNEDKLIIEAQQQIINRDPSRSVVPVSCDKGVIMFQRTMARLLREENPASAAD